MTPKEFTSCLAQPSPPTGLSVPLAALWRDAKGDWTRSHALVDELETADGMAVHAYCTVKRVKPPTPIIGTSALDASFSGLHSRPSGRRWSMLCPPAPHNNCRNQFAGSLQIASSLSCYPFGPAAYVPLRPDLSVVRFFERHSILVEDGLNFLFRLSLIVGNRPDRGQHELRPVWVLTDLGLQWVARHG
jgi:hypothetical protein